MNHLKLVESKERRKRVVFALLMGMITTVVISFTIVAINVGFNNLFLKIWLRSWFTAYLFVVPTILYVAPLVQKIINRLFEEH